MPRRTVSRPTASSTAGERATPSPATRSPSTDPATASTSPRTMTATPLPAPTPPRPRPRASPTSTARRSEPVMQSNLRIAVIGTGYLGATHAACMAALGYEVLGVDVDKAKIDALASGVLPFYEPGLDT